MTTLILMRHGETDWNALGWWQGQADPPLNGSGRAQARHLADELRGQGLDALYSSDLRRAMGTAGILAATFGLPVILDRRLREIDLGWAEGMLAAEVQASAPEQFRLWYESPLDALPFGHENARALAARTLAAVNDIAAHHVGQRVGVVSHQLPIAIVRCASQGLAMEHFRRFVLPNGSYQEVMVSEPLRER
jgi:broad specificity phosphatase PhoE